MNILIKNADFSSVSIGTAGSIEKTSTLTNVNFIEAAVGSVAGIGYAKDTKIICYDVSSIVGKLVKVTGFKGSSAAAFARFYSAVAPSDTSYISGDMSSLNAYFGAPLTEVKESSSGIKTEIVEVPSGAKTLCVYAGGNYAEQCMCVELL